MLRLQQPTSSRWLQMPIPNGADTMPGLHSIYEEPWSEEYQSAFLEMYHRVFDRIEAVVGEHVWNFADFQTSSGIVRVDGNKKGAFT